MTERELDALMWQLINGKPLDLLRCRYVDDDVQPHGGYPIGHVSPSHYSTTTDGAMEVFEAMTARGYKFHVSKVVFKDKTRMAFFKGRKITNAVEGKRGDWVLFYNAVLKAVGYEEKK